MMIRLLAADGDERWVPDADIVPMSYVIYVKGAPVVVDTWVLNAKKPPPTEADGGGLCGPPMAPESLSVLL
jgi:hypothetical protein